jgi:DNA polymerase III subunit epsilon
MFSLFRGKGKKFKGISEKASIKEAPYVVVDTELTGLNETKDSIVSIGAVRMTGGRIELGNTFYHLVSPRTKLSAESVVIHEITPSDVKSEPAIESILDDFLAYCGNAVLVGHFVSIDLNFLNREILRTGRAAISNPVIDTFSIYEWLRKRNLPHTCFEIAPEAYRLFDIGKCFGIPVNGAHNAFKDAYTTAQLFQRFLPLLIEAGVSDIKDLLRRGTPFKGGDSFKLTNDFSNF